MCRNQRFDLAVGVRSSLHLRAEIGPTAAAPSNDIRRLPALLCLHRKRFRLPERWRRYRKKIDLAVLV